jgi:predicted helicase
MSRSYVDAYFRELAELRRVGALNEEPISAAFGTMLKSWGRARDLVFLQQQPVPGTRGRDVRPDGLLRHSIRLDFGLWEAKREGVDLDAAIAAKKERGYPLKNTIFENGATAVLYQHGAEARRAAMQDADALEGLVAQFFAYERPEIAGFKKAVEAFRADLPAVLEALRARIDEAFAANPAFRTEAAAFLEHARTAINAAVGEADVREMLIQHILTEEIFNRVFDEADFHRKNNVAAKLYELEETFFTGADKKATLRALDPYYKTIYATAQMIESHAEKQAFLKTIYENFYKIYDPHRADRLGVVYTPNEIVRFMIEGADWLCREHFGRGLADEGVDILDPATGTGTFVCELLSFMQGIEPQRLHRKYTRELHANEVAILPYYVANLNIEATYFALTGQYAEFPTLCFVDTLDNTDALGAPQRELFGSISAENSKRIRAQNGRKITLVIGNPPYNAWQENFDDENPNRPYRRIDDRIRDTYTRAGTAQNKIALYDMYVRFWRWASDRLDDHGMIAFVTNRNFIEKASFDGFRRSVAKEFAHIYVMDLGGDVRANPKLSGTKHNVFGIQTGVAIAFMVKKKAAAPRIHYARRDEFDTADEKLSYLGATHPRDVKWERVEPDRSATWVGAADNDWDSLTPLAEKGVPAHREVKAVFRLFTNGLKTQRDEWAYDRTREGLAAKMRFFADAYEAARKDKYAPEAGAIKWDADLSRHQASGTRKAFDDKAIVKAEYRPFATRFLYFDSQFNGRTYQWPRIVGKGDPNPVISVSDVGYRADYCVFSSDGVVDLHFGAAADAYQCLPRYRYAPSGERLDNITDWAVKAFEKRYGKGAGVTKDAIFAYVYAALHDPVWRATYAANLKRDFPRVPLHPDFARWAGWGRRLLDLHIGYESVEPWPLTRRDAPDEKRRAAGLAPKPVLKSDPAAGTVTLDSETVLSGFPAECWTYRLGNRAAVDWVLDQHKEKAIKDPTVRERFDTYRFADHKEACAGLLARVARVSRETMGVVAEIAAAPRD